MAVLALRLLAWPVRSCSSPTLPASFCLLPFTLPASLALLPPGITTATCLYLPLGFTCSCMARLCASIAFTVSAQLCLKRGVAGGGGREDVLPTLDLVIAPPAFYVPSKHNGQHHYSPMNIPKFQRVRLRPAVCRLRHLQRDMA